MGAGSGGGDLLAEHRAQGQLGRLDRARHPPAGVLVHLRRQRGVGAQLLVDRGGIGVEIEQPAASADRRRQIPQVGQRKLTVEVGVARWVVVGVSWGVTLGLVYAQPVTVWLSAAVTTRAVSRMVKRSPTASTAADARQ